METMRKGLAARIAQTAGPFGYLNNFSWKYLSKFWMSLHNAKQGFFAHIEQKKTAELHRSFYGASCLNAKIRYNGTFRTSSPLTTPFIEVFTA